MTFLLFTLGKDRYAIEATRVVEVLPCAALKKVPHTPPGIAGVLDYHGTPVPVADVNAMALGTPAKENLSTRLLIVHYRSPETGERLLGLLAEGATDIARLAPEDFDDPGVSAAPGAPYLGRVARLETVSSGSSGLESTRASRLVQRVEIEQLLTPETRERLWKPTAGAE